MSNKQNSIHYFDAHTHQIRVSDDVTAIRNIIVGHDSTEPSAVSVCSVGIHPWYWKQANSDELRAWATLPTVKAIGECGLDRLTNTSLTEQQPVFEYQIALAETVQKPLIIHCVRAFAEVVALRRHHQPRQPWVMHGFNNRISFLDMLLEAGFYVSLGAALLRPDSPAAAAIQRIPRHRLFLETDDKDLSISAICTVAAQLLDCPIEELASQLADNAREVFAL